ncbi:MAG: LacI family transcriptional regulator [Vallitaleaceae bacterium]|nr:LacI family transcriptional regulator [Vallitaleaceae bacterium]
MKRTTIQDVAQAAGVSITTVSRVINNNYPVKASTRKKVEKAVDTLKFKPNLLARSLIQNSTKTVGILTPSIENLFFSEVIKGVNSILKEKGYTTFLCHTEGEATNEVEVIHSLVDRRVDGMVVLDPRKENVVSGYFEELAKRVPLLLVNGYAQGTGCSYVLNDGEGGARMALKYLITEGCKRIVFLRGKKSHSYDIKEEVYLEFMKAHGMESRILRIKDGNDIKTVEQAKEAVADYIRSGEKPDALLACNDWMAVGALSGAKSEGLLVPKDMRIIGFDNTIISMITEPKLSTVDQQMTKLGQLAGNRIYKMMTTKDIENQKTYLETRLMIRES